MKSTPRIVKFFRKGNLFLVILRMPGRLFRQLKRNAINIYWRMFLAQCGGGVRIGLGVIIDIPKNVHLGNNVIIGDDVEIGSENLTGKLIIKDGVQINKNCIIDHTGNVTIDENVLISSEVLILSHSHGYDPRSKSQGIQKKIKKNVWIGTRSVISEKCSLIEENCVVGLSSVVTKDCSKKNAIYAGIPAKYIKEINV